MRKIALSLLLINAIVCTSGCSSNPPVNEPTVKVEQADQITLSVPDGIDPQQTSDDPTYGYTAENPIKVGGADEFSGPSTERLYLRHLRDSKFRPFRFHRLGSYGGNPDEHMVDGYELTDQDGETYMLYIDMYHIDVHPFNVKAPKGMYFWK